MSLRRAMLPAAAAAALPSAASAHMAQSGLGPFYDGLLHPLISLEDLLPVLALAILAGLRGALHARWLLLVAAMIWAMVALGGATRLTGSGLSIMEWAPLSGTLPPLSEAEWQRLYDLYRTIPQYQLVNAGFGIEGFQQIFWLEWSHRLWGRLIGLAFALRG